MPAPLSLFKHTVLAIVFLHFSPGLANAQTPLPSLDEQRVAAAGMRKITGDHLTIYTDLPSAPAVDGLAGQFDQFHVRWLDYFQLKEQQQLSPMRAFLMRERSRFVANDLLPRDVPDFRNGYARGAEFWVVDQKSDYYRRHLLFHEGVHALMHVHFGSAGPPWYAEGMAELLATHRMTDGKVEAPWFPHDRRSVPDWGRTRLVRDSIAAGRSYSADEMLETDMRIASRENELYGWCWAFAAFLDGHPAYRQRFRSLPRFLRAENFNAVTRRAFKADWRELDDEWRLFVSRIDYGYDLKREAVEFKPGAALAPSGAKAEIHADRGWQSSGVLLSSGKSYRITVTGQFQIAETTKPWLSEPQGVSIRYVDGQPLGMLLGAIRPNDREGESASPFTAPVPIGADATISPAATGVLYLRVNDSPSELSDNRGAVTAEVVEAK